MSRFDDPEYIGIYPVSFVMRNARPDEWFRIHSLPNSKRYPETDLEREVLIGRHRQFSNALLAEGSPCRIHYTIFTDEGISDDVTPVLEWSYPVEALSEYDQAIFTQTTNASWDFERFLPWIMLSAEADFGFISFHSLATDAIYAPYDGGADAFCADPAFLTEIEEKFGEWTSNRPDGL